MHLKPLTSLRFLFALMVFVSHLDFLKRSNYDWLRTTYQNILVEGYIGVSFFFILSGFILTHVYRSQIDGSRKENKKFFIARFARIYPLHFATFLIAVPLMFWGQEIDLRGCLIGLSNATLTQSYVPIKELYFSFNGPSWSVSCEVFFYLCFPFLLGFFNKIGKLKYYLTAVSALAILILPHFIAIQWQHGLFYINQIFRVVDFILGMVLYDLYVQLKNKKALINFTRLELLRSFTLLTLPPLRLVKFVSTLLPIRCVLASLKALAFVTHSKELKN
jgi:peptidoglycan/LPS O-acetylase OafA/YrhL